MTEPQKVLLPDIGDFTDVEVIEIHVAVGSDVSVEDPLLTLESDKATMDVPSPVAGTITEIAVELGDKISEGDHLLSVEGSGPTHNDAVPAPSEQDKSASRTAKETKSHADTHSPAAGGQKVLLPDIGDFTDVEIIEIHVSVGSDISAEDPILTLESDKATMDVPSPVSGKITELAVKLGEKISEGDHLLSVESSTPQSAAADESEPRIAGKSSKDETSADDERAGQLDSDIEIIDLPKPPPSLPPPVERSKGLAPHASPSVRRFARELGADLSQVRGTGVKGRIVKDDVVLHVKGILQGKSALPSGALPGPPPIPEVDFSKFGEVETVKLNKIKKLTGDRLHRSWLDIPHVTHHDEADITELEIFRKNIDAEQRVSGTRVTILAFICKAIVNALQEHPTFNCSLSTDAQSLIIKKYINIGVAVDTPNGLVVPVIKNIQTLGVLDIAKTLQKLGAAARESKLTPADYQGGCFTISSLGGIGGRFFTPIINPPEVAILGVSRHKVQPFQSDDGIAWKTMLPLSLSYDHRVIDGAEAARFTKFVCELLYDSRRILL